MPNLSPELLARIDRIDGCRGRWIVDNRKVDGDYSYAMRSLGESIPGLDGVYHRVDNVSEAARLCASFHWRGPLLLWHSDWLDADCGWPGGYSADSVMRSNARMFRAEFAMQLAAGADGDGPGLSLDVRYLDADMLEALEALEQYPLLDEDDHSALQLEDQAAAWESWAESDWRRAIGKRLAEFAPPEADAYWGSEQAEALTSEMLWELWRHCDGDADWIEEQGDAWVDVEQVAQRLDTCALREALPLT